MITDPEHTYLYFDLTKTASQAVISVLRKYYGGEVVTEIPEHVDCLFTVVRNPYTRILSAWWSLCQTGGDYYEMNRLGLHGTDFPTFLQWLVEVDHREKEFLFGFGVAKLFLTMTDHLDGLVPDRILRYESLDEQFRSLPFHRGMPEEIPVVNRKGMMRGPDKDYLTSDVVQIINRYYAEDFKRFDYEMRNVDAV